MPKKERILQAAVKVFADKGFFRATIDDIAREAGVAVGTIYNYFASKDQVLEEIFQAEARRRKAFARELEQQTLPRLEKLAHLVKLHFSSLQSNSALARVISAERAVVRKANPDLFAPDGGMVQIIADILSCTDSSEPPQPNPHLCAVLIFGMMDTIMERALYRNDFAVDDAVAEMMRVLKQGL